MYASDLKHPTLEDKLTQLYTLNRNKKIDLSFRPPYLQLLERLGNPHLRLPPIIHVAGTNGKGSTIAMLRSVLEAAGYAVHAYTSPHLVKFNERIVLAGAQIEDAPLEALIDEVLERNAGGDLTFFEVTTALAFTAFAKAPADIILLEVGMGGRLDCTNVIETPLLTIITAIGIDHAEHLGSTIEAIAGEKAGIIKSGAPCVIGHQNHRAAIKVFEDKAAAMNAPLYYPDEDSQYETALLGPHQKHNLSAAIKTLELIKDQFPVSDDQIKTGLNSVQWPARLQKLESSKFALSPETELFLDGGHNEDAGRALAQQAKQWQEQDSRPLHIITGMMQGKDTAAFLKHLQPFAASFVLVNIEAEPMSQSAQDLLKALPTAQTVDNFREALKTIPQGSRILICGSLYLAGHVLKHAQTL